MTPSPSGASVGLRCPHCAGRAMSGSRKLVCGIAQKPKCRSCGKAIRLHPRDLLVLLPAAVIGAWWAVDPSTAASVALAGGFALYVVLHQAWVPFVAAE